MGDGDGEERGEDVATGDDNRSNKQESSQEEEVEAQEVSKPATAGNVEVR